MANFVGKWKLESSDNFDEYMRAVGVGAIMAKLGSTAKPTVYITIEGDNWSLKSETTFKTSKCEFQLGKEFEETTADDRKMMTTFTLENENKLVQDQKGEIPSVITRELTSPDTMVAVCVAKDVTAKRTYKKST